MLLMDLSKPPFDYAGRIAEARRSYRPGPSLLELLDSEAADLLAGAGSVTSQFGEDGIFAALFERIGTRNRWCFEVGAGDGVFLSNTLVLRQDGWSAVLIEADPNKLEILQAHAREEDGAGERLHCHLATIEPGDLDDILGSYDVPTDLDLGIIDIDGQDIRILNALGSYRPRALLVEFNARGDGEVWDNGPWQAGRESIIAAGKAKGYRPLLQCGVNVLFLEDGEPF